MERASIGPARWQGFAKRALFAAILAPAALVPSWVGGIWFETFLALIMTLAACEWCMIVHKRDPVQTALHVVAVVLCALLPAFAGPWAALALAGALWVVSHLLLQARQTRLSKWHSIGIPYLALPTIAFAVLRRDNDYGMQVIFWLLAVVWLADTAAYVFGRIIGGPKLAPVVSPNKTWAGLAGAVLGGMIGSALIAISFGLAKLPALLLLGAVFSVIEQMGDLFESAAKRFHNIKDSGNLIPGHGGVLDRIDGLLAAGLFAGLLGTMRDGIEAAGAGVLVW